MYADGSMLIERDVFVQERSLEDGICVCVEEEKMKIEEEKAILKEDG